MPDRPAAARRMTPLNSMYCYYERMLAGSGMNANSCEWIELDGPVDAAALRAAAAAVQRKHPVLGAAAPDWRRWLPGAAPAPELVEERRDGLEGADAVNLLAPNVWRRQLPLKTGPALRLHLTRIGARSVLQLVTSHLYTDGRSANILVADLLAAYHAAVAGEPFDDAPVDVPDRDLHALYLARLPPAERRRLTLRAAAAVARDAAAPCQRIATPGRPRGMTKVILRPLGEPLLARLREASARSGMSRHPFYVLAAARSIAAFNARRGRRGDAPLRFIDNVSVRRFGDPPPDGLYELCAIPYMLRVDPSADDATLMRRAADGVAALHRGGALVEIARQRLLAASAALTPKVLGLQMVLGAVVKSNFILTNIGHVPDATWSHPSLDVRGYYSFSQLFPPGAFMLFLSTARQDLRAVCLYDSGNLSHKDALELLDGFEATLREGAEASAARTADAGRADLAA